MVRNGLNFDKMYRISIVLCLIYFRLCSNIEEQKSWVRVSAGHYGVKTLGKFLTPMCLCHQAV